ncbi:hypothetical protein [Pontibacter russatus]|uniref:hypothetical protein n=1 Tax=Pontibacter russatus TaxID=2694929 RepID=UPI0013796972|nr:hypothetical protein [Pontibacter russatus]
MAKQENKVEKDFPFQYAAKFFCTSNIPGTSQTTGAFLPGTYLTVVNIHNPNDYEVKTRKKLASPVQISDYLYSSLKADGVERVTCDQIKDFTIHSIHGFEGFLIIESTHSLDVVAVYTAGQTGGNVVSLDVEAINERRILSPPDETPY